MSQSDARTAETGEQVSCSVRFIPSSWKKKSCLNKETSVWRAQRIEKTETGGIACETCQTPPKRANPHQDDGYQLGAWGRRVFDVVEGLGGRAPDAV